jgi:hypothetical protein
LNKNRLFSRKCLRKDIKVLMRKSLQAEQIKQEWEIKVVIVHL